MTEQTLNKEAVQAIEELIKSQEVFLFMKGTPDQPQCGFSAQVVHVLAELDVPFGSFDILSDGDVRETLKAYANWPTFPQLWVKGKLIGGCDIIMELAESGELKAILDA